MANKTTIGELIENEVRKQQLNITKFAEDICCQRSNVYDIFKRSKMDVTQLALISKVLKRNFFKDLADDPDLICLEDEETMQELKNRKSVSLFMDIMPGILISLGLHTTIVYTQFQLETNQEDMDVYTPDFGLADVPVSFTIGCRLLEKYKGDPGALLKVETFQTPSGLFLDLWTNLAYGSKMIDIAIDGKTEDQWVEVMQYVKDNFLGKNPVISYEHQVWNRF